MKFPQVLPPSFPYNKWRVRTLLFFYVLVLPQQLRRWYRTEVRTRLCRHTETYPAVDWSYSEIRCSRCHKTLEKSR